MPSSTVCRYEHFETEWHRRFCDKLGLTAPDQRKAWEFTAICAALEERGMLRPGHKALGFAVGREPLASYFASCGVEVLATDLVAQQEDRWKKLDQHATSSDAVHYPSIVDRASFDRLVSFRSADMRRLEDGLGLESYDFLWSACALEHLGSLARGMDFVRNAMRFLKPGGIALHTTEYNVSSNTRTKTRGGSVIYRRRDLEELDYSLRMQRAGLEPMDFDAGTHEYDLNYDEPPFGLPGRKHIKLKFFGHIFTSALLVIRKA
ncbi:SAM-dependent methyltransferase [Xanthobacteraceae bacterium A53D]